MIQKDVRILRHEFIGRHVFVQDKGITGTIIDETKHSFVIRSKEAKKRVLKKNAHFSITMENEIHNIPGSIIEMRPEDRIKIKKWK